MLNIRRNYSEQTGLMLIMSEIAVQAAAVKTRMTEIAGQASALATGLQNAAPGDKDAPNPSIQYLSAIAEVLHQLAEDCEVIIHPGSGPSVNDSTSKSGN